MSRPSRPLAPVVRPRARAPRRRRLRRPWRHVHDPDLGMLGGSNPVTLTAACSPYDPARRDEFQRRPHHRGLAWRSSSRPAPASTSTAPAGSSHKGTAQAPVVLRARRARRLARRHHRRQRQRPGAGAPELHPRPRLRRRRPRREGLLQHNASTAPVAARRRGVLAEPRARARGVRPLAPASAGVRVEPPALAAVHLRQGAPRRAPRDHRRRRGHGARDPVEGGAIAAGGTVRPQPVPIHVLRVAQRHPRDDDHRRAQPRPHRARRERLGRRLDDNTAGLVVEPGVTFDCAGAGCAWRGVLPQPCRLGPSMTGTVIARPSAASSRSRAPRRRPSTRAPINSSPT